MDTSTAEDENTSELQEDSDSSSVVEAMWECDTSPNLKGRIDAPSYTSNFTTVLQEPNAQNPLKVKSAPSRNNCFNCMGDHLINDCPHPRNQRAIMKNRREFMNKNSGFFRQASRYHLGEDQMYAYMVPGKISKSLRQALGLSDKQLPLHIYRMRLFGYPPGWLQDARVSRSGIALYVDSEKNEIPTPGDEEGEIVSDGSKDTYDLSKIHDFPGFNVPPAPDTIDESRFYKCPPQQVEQSKEAMIQSLESQKATSSSYTKLPSIPLMSKTEDSSTDCDEPNSNSAPEHQETPRVERCPSPSLEDLEAKKQSLMAELLTRSSTTELTSSSNDMDVGESSEPGLVSDQDLLSPSKSVPLISHKDANTVSLGSVDGSSPSACTVVNGTTDVNSSDGDQLCTPKNSGSVRRVEVGSSPDRGTPYSRTSTPQSVKIGTVKQIDQGTPILKSASPYSYLPSPDKFSQGISDVINFENLPDALGHYKRMNGIIHTVRSQLKRK